MVRGRGAVVCAPAHFGWGWGVFAISVPLKKNFGPGGVSYLLVAEKEF